MALSRKRKIIISVAAVAVVALVVIVSVLAGGKDEPEVTVVKVAKRPELRSTVTASGEVRPVKFINLTSEVGGRIEEIYVKPGDHVTQGQPLVRLDPTQLQSSQEAQTAAVQASYSDVQNARQQVVSAETNVQQAQQGLNASEAGLASAQQQVVTAQTSVDRAKVDLNTAQRELKRQTELVEAGVSSRSEYDAARDRLDQAQVALRTAQAQLQQQRVAVEEAKARVNQQKVAVQDAQNGVKRAQVGVQTAEARVNQPVKIKIDAMGERELPGKVTEKNPLAVSKSDTSGGGMTNRVNTQEAKEFKVVIELDKSGGQIPDDVWNALRPGMTATTVITTNTKRDVLSVPLQAVIEKPAPTPTPGANAKGAAPTPQPSAGEKPKDVKGVYVVDKSNKVKFQPVETGLTGESEIEITSGLKENDEVITGPSRVMRTLKDGATIKRSTGRPTGASNDNAAK